MKRLAIALAAAAMLASAAPASAQGLYVGVGDPYYGGWGANWGGNLDADKRQVLDQLIAKGFVEPADQQSIATFKHTLKASLLLAELCVGISGTLLR